mgnify:CR=1 FL=1
MTDYYNLQKGNSYNQGYAVTDSESYNKSRRSKCPRGALLGSIGSCCGLDCTRKCAEEA